MSGRADQHDSDLPANSRAATRRLAAGVVAVLTVAAAVVTVGFHLGSSRSGPSSSNHVPDAAPLGDAARPTPPSTAATSDVEKQGAAVAPSDEAVAKKSEGRDSAAMEATAGSTEHEELPARDVFLKAGREAMDAGRLEEAVASYRKAEAVGAPGMESSLADLAFAFVQRANERLATQSFAEAAADFAAAVELDPGLRRSVAPGWADALAESAVRRPAKTPVAEVSEQFAAALALQPGSPTILALRAEWHRSSGRTDEAVADWTAAASADPERSRDWLRAAGRARFDAMGGALKPLNLPAAVEAMSAAVAVDPAGAAVYRRQAAKTLRALVDDRLTAPDRVDPGLLTILDAADGWDAP
ncbi:MAG: hypothetical protein ACRDD1_13920, partial [Planctomycetia bacterium]